MAEDTGLNVEEAVGSIASDIGLGAEDANRSDEETQQVDDSAAQGDQQDAGTDSGKQDGDGEAAQQGEDQVRDAAAAAGRTPPKSWAKEKHEVWSKLDPAAQEYIELREKQMLDGLTQYTNDAKFAKAVKEVISPHIELIRAQQIEPAKAIEYLFNAHRQLSSGTPEARTAFLAEVAKTYGLDLAKAAALAGQQAQEPESVRQLRERTERLERERQAELSERQAEQAKRIEKQVSDFADAKDEKGNPKHPYFDECAEHIVKLIQGGYSLEDAYQVAIYANPVTKEKELSRLQAEKETALRAKAKQDAERARNASRTNVNSRDTRREPTAHKAGKWEDSLEQTMQEIKARQTH